MTVYLHANKPKKMVNDLWVRTKLFRFLPVLLFGCVFLQQCFISVPLLFSNANFYLQQNLCHGFNFQPFGPIVSSWMWKPPSRKHPSGFHTVVNNNHMRHFCPFFFCCVAATKNNFWCRLNYSQLVAIISFLFLTFSKWQYSKDYC